MSKIIKYTVFYLALSLKVYCYWEFADYQKVVNSKCFVDKSLLIKELIHDEVILVTAPSYFGKSTNMDMVRRFFQLNVEGLGNESTSSDFELFRSGKLKIYRDKQFFSEHFGSRPVIFIDCSLMYSSIDFRSALKFLKIIIKGVYERHSYLLRVEELWSERFDSDYFKDFIIHHENLTISRLENSFMWLSEILHEHFKKKVYVLIDEYDAFIRKFILKKVKGIEQIVELFKTIVHRLLVSNPHVRGALITGTLNIFIDGLLELGNNTRHCGFLSDHNLSKYFGFTRKDVLMIIKSSSELEYQREKFKKHIFPNYGGYENIYKNHTLYDINLVTKYLALRIHYYTPILGEYFSSAVEQFRHKPIWDVLIRLLQGEPIPAKISKPLSKNDIALLSDIHDPTVSITISKASLDVYFRFLFEFGHIVTQGNSLRLPNIAQEQKIANGFYNYFTECLSVTTFNPVDLCIRLERVSPDKSRRRIFRKLLMDIQHSVFDNKYEYTDPIALRDFIYILLKRELIYTYTERRIPLLNRTGILIRNANNISFLMTFEFCEELKEKIRFRSVKHMIYRMIQNEYTHVLDPDAQKRAVLISLLYYPPQNYITFGYSKRLNESDDLYYVIVVERGKHELLYTRNIKRLY